MKKGFLFFLAAASFCVMGCKSLLPKAVPYSFAPEGSPTAAITFQGGGIDLVKYGDAKLPVPKIKTYWSPFLFPAGKKLNLRLHMVRGGPTWISSTPWGLVILPISIMLSVRAWVSFYCPPLEAGKEYKLSFRSGFSTLGRKLVLQDAQTGQIIYEQKF